MKKFLLKVVPIAGDPDGRTLNYRDQLLALVRNFPDGISIAEMGDAISVSKKLRGAGDTDTLVLENAEHAYLLDRLDGNRFTIAAEEIVEMRNTLAHAEEIPAPHLVSTSPGRESKRRA